MRTAPIASRRERPLSTMPTSNRLVATLVAHPDRPAVTDALIDAAARAIGRETATDAVLARDPAADSAVQGPDDPRAVEERLREAVGADAVDVIVQPTATRRKRLLLADMDSTMIGQECIDELADYVGLKPRSRRSRSGPCAARSPSSRRCASAWRSCEPAGRGRRRDRSRPRITLTPGGAELVRDHAGQRRLYLPRLGRLHRSSPARSRPDRLRRAPRQPARRRGRQARRAGSRSRSSAARPSWRR